MTRRIEDRTLLEKLDHVKELTGTYYSDSDPTYYCDAVEVFAALRERLLAEPDPIAELEAMGGGSRLCIVESDGTYPMTLVWPVVPGGDAEEVEWPYTITHIRAAAARLLARVRGAK